MKVSSRSAAFVPSGATASKRAPDGRVVWQWTRAAIGCQAMPSAWAIAAWTLSGSNGGQMPVGEACELGLRDGPWLEVGTLAHAAITSATARAATHRDFTLDIVRGPIPEWEVPDVTLASLAPWAGS